MWSVCQAGAGTMDLGGAIQHHNSQQLAGNITTLARVPTCGRLAVGSLGAVLSAQMEIGTPFPS